MLPLDDFQRDMSAMLARVKATPRQPGVDEIRLPGERAVRERARLKRDGIEIDRKIYDALRGVAAGKAAAASAVDPSSIVPLRIDLGVGDRGGIDYLCGLRNAEPCLSRWISNDE